MSTHTIAHTVENHVKTCMRTCYHACEHMDPQGGTRAPVAERHAGLKMSNKFDQLERCERMLVLLDERTFNSDSTMELDLEIQAAMRHSIHVAPRHSFLA